MIFSERNRCGVCSGVGSYLIGPRPEDRRSCKGCDGVGYVQPATVPGLFADKEFMALPKMACDVPLSIDDELKRLVAQKPTYHTVFGVKVACDPRLSEDEFAVIVSLDAYRKLLQMEQEHGTNYRNDPGG